MQVVTGGDAVVPASLQNTFIQYILDGASVQDNWERAGVGAGTGVGGGAAFLRLHTPLSIVGLAL